MRISDWSSDVCSSDLSPIADAEFPPADRAIGLCPDAVQIISHGASIAQPDQRHQRPRPPACGGRERKRKAGGLRDGLVAGRESRGGPSWRSPMDKEPQKLVLIGPLDLPFDPLHLSHPNYRKPQNQR